MKKIIYSAIGTIVLLIALVLNLRHSMNDYGLFDNMYIKAFAEGTNDLDNNGTVAGTKKKYYRLRNTNADCTITKVTTTTNVTTTPIGSTTVTEQTTVQVKGKYYVCEEATETTGTRSCTEGCAI